MSDDDDPEFFDTGEFEVRDDGGIWEEVVDEWEDGTDVEMPGLEDGLHPDLIDSLREITSDTGARRRASIRAVEPDSGMVGMSDMAAATSDHATYDTFDIEVQHEEANALLKHIYSKLNEAHDKCGHVETIVIGLPQFHVLEPWAQAEHNKSIEDVIPPSVTVVPGPVIHPVIDNRILYTEYLRDKEDDDGS